MLSLVVSIYKSNIESRTPRENFAGIIQSACCPEDQLLMAYDDAKRLCEYHLGVAPDIQIETNSPAKPITFTYLPSHLNYMLTEILKNSCKATMEQHPHDPPPIQALITQSKSDVTIRISDRGGGIDRANLPKIWSYLYSSVTDESIQAQLLEQDGNVKSVLAGYGVGLPLSRLYSRYFGGDMDLKSMHGYGSDAYLHIPRFFNCENLPQNVCNSPAQGTSSLQRGASQLFFFGNRSSWEENVAVGNSEPSHSSTKDS